MALIDCRGCGRSMSNRALACPHCGEPGVSTSTSRRHIPAFMAKVEMMPSWLVVFSILIVVFGSGTVMTGVVFSRFEDAPTASPSAPPPPSVSQQVTSRDGRVQLSLPPGWIKTLPEGEEMLLLVHLAERGVAISVFAEDKAALGEVDLRLRQLDDYAELMRGLLLQELVGGGEEAPIHTTVAGHPAVQCTLHGTIDGEQFKFLQTIVETPTTFYQVRGVASLDEFDSARDELVEVTRSFQVSASQTP